MELLKKSMVLIFALSTGAALSACMTSSQPGESSSGARSSTNEPADTTDQGRGPARGDAGSSGSSSGSSTEPSGSSGSTK